MKTLVAALGCASLLATALPAAADPSHHGGGGSAGEGWSHAGVGTGSGGGWSHAGGPPLNSPSGAPQTSPGGTFARPHSGFPSGSFAGRPGFGGDHFGHHFHPRFIGFRGYPYYFADFGLGFALGLSVLDPWYYDYGPYYAGYAYRPYGPPPGGYYYPAPPAGYAPPPAQAAPPSGDAAAPPPAACGSWKWDNDKQTYNWVPCAS